MKDPKPIIGKWQFIHSFGRDPYRLCGRAYTIGLIKFIYLPGIGERIQTKHHSGKAITIRFCAPLVTFYRRYFQIFGMQQMITYPTWINFKYIFDVEVW